MRDAGRRGNSGHKGSRSPGSTGSTGRDTGRWCSGRLSARGRHCAGGGGGGSGRGLFPRPPSARTGPSSDGVQGRIDLPGIVAGHAIFSLILGSAKTLEVLAVQGFS
jgi:hypothetical protein